MPRILALALFIGLSALTLQSAAAERFTLMQLFLPWQYPGSTWGGGQVSDAATVDAGGDRTIPSFVCKSAMTTDDPVETVVAYYKTKLGPAPAADDPTGDSAKDTARSVIFNDDSAGRPFAMHTIQVNTADTSTLLIITRGQEESKTHIAWKQYRRVRP